jgi:hypothetical protein
MSTAEWFGLLPLSKYYVRKSEVQPGPQTNLGLTKPIASGFIQVNGTNRTGNPVGMYTWYRLSHFTGSPNIQGAELREYLVVFRDVSSEANVSFDIPIPEGGFNANYHCVRFLYTDITVTNPGAGTNTVWNISLNSTLTHIRISAQTSVTPMGQSFFFYVTGI